MRTKRIRLITLSLCLALVAAVFLYIKVSNYRKNQLFDAIRKGDRDSIEALLNWGALVNASTKGKVTYSPLLYAVVFGGDMAIADILIEHGANVNAMNNLGQTPLHRAAGGGQKQMVELLLANGADASITDDFGETPLDYVRQELRREKEYDGKVNLEILEIVELLEKNTGTKAYR